MVLRIFLVTWRFSEKVLSVSVAGVAKWKKAKKKSVKGGPGIT